ncbi:MAG: diacylglycerol/lipid kinase family protein, partial [Acidimicrobiia bacterium]
RAGRGRQGRHCGYRPGSRRRLGCHMTWWAVIDPGVAKTGPVQARAANALRERGIEAEIHAAASAAEAEGIVDNGIRAGHRRFLVVGGDGTVNLAVNSLLGHRWERPPMLGILPAGPGCDFIRTFGISQRLEEAADRLLGDKEYRVDVGVLEGSWGHRHFVNVADAGITAATARLAERLPGTVGRARRRIAFWLILPGFRPAELQLRVGHRQYQGRATAVVVANAQFFADGMNVAPKATLVDGVLDIQVFTGAKPQALTLLPKVRHGLHLRHPAVNRFRGDEFSLESDRPWPVEADGSYLGDTPFRGRVLPAALNVKI